MGGRLKRQAEVGAPAPLPRRDRHPIPRHERLRGRAQVVGEPRDGVGPEGGRDAPVGGLGQGAGDGGLRVGVATERHREPDGRLHGVGVEEGD